MGRSPPKILSAGSKEHCLSRISQQQPGNPPQIPGEDTCQSVSVVDGDLVKVVGWYDNEWGYASQMIREAVQMTREFFARK